MRVVDRDGRTVFVSKYHKNTDGSSSGILAEITYSSESDQNGSWAQIAIGHDADGKAYFETGCPSRLNGGLAVSGGALTSSGAVSFSNSLTVSGSANLNGGATVKNNDFTVSGANAYFTGNISVGGVSTFSGDVRASARIYGNDFRTFISQQNALDMDNPPASDEQRWPVCLFDKNGTALAYCKYIYKASGAKAWQFLLANRTDPSDNVSLLGLAVYVDANGNYSAQAPTPANDSNGDEIVTTSWLRSYNWDASRGQIVHTVNSETIDGVKTFQKSISVSANPLIQSTNWSGIGIADSTRSATTNKMMAQILDKDGKRFLGLEVTSGNDGSRQFQFNARNRNDDGWTIFLRCIEYADGSQNLTAGQHPPAGDNSLRLATTGWVVSQLSTSIPAGAIMYFAQSDVPDGWLFCNGSNVSRTTYASLFAAIGTKYGSGNGSSTFTLPNLRDIFIQGASSTSNVGQTVAAGLPNITGSFVSVYGGNSVSGAFTSTGSGHTKQGTDWDGQAISFSASASSGIYGASTTVQPPAIRLLPCIKS